MASREKARFEILAASVFGLTLALGCGNGGSGDAGAGGMAGGGGVGGSGGDTSIDTPVGPAFADIAGIVGETIGGDSRFVDGTRFAASRAARALTRALAEGLMMSAPAASPKGGDDPPCALGPIDGLRFEYDAATDRYEAAGVPVEPDGSVSFDIYELVNDVPANEVPSGKLMLSCREVSDGARVSATLRVDATDVLHVEGHTTPDGRQELDSFEVTQLTGFLASSDGARRTDFGEAGQDRMTGEAEARSGAVVFQVGPAMTASLEYDEPVDGEALLQLSVTGTNNGGDFDFSASLSGNDGRVVGAGILDEEQAICCFDGRLEAMAAAEATRSCVAEGYAETPVSEDEISAIQAGYDALAALYVAVESAARGMGAIASASAKHLLHTPPDCDNLPEPEGDDCLSVPIELQLDPTYDPTFSAIYDELFCSRGCASNGCHSDGDGGLRFRSKEQAYCAIVDAPTSALCENDFSAIVVPADPEGSLLVAKLGFEPSCGTPMPIGSRESNDLVTDAHREQVVSWIAAGAEYNPLATQVAVQ